MIGAAAAASKGDEDASAIFTSLVNSAFGEGAMRLGGIWRAADWRRHVLEPRRRRGHALGKRPSLRALSGAASPPLVSLVCPPARPLPKHKTCAPSPAVPGARWPRPLSSCGPPSPVRGAPPKCSNGRRVAVEWGPRVLLALPVFGP